MLTQLTIRNFKRFDSVDIPLASPVVLVGPNNSGKTSALQALALWELGLRRWREKRHEKGTPEKRPGVAINRRDLMMVPVAAANLLWRRQRVRNVQRVGGRTQTQNVRIDVLVDGYTGGKDWRCGLEFDFANDENFFCRPLRLEERKDPPRMEIPDAAYDVRVAYLPPMSGLTSNETRLDAGAINVRLGEGRTAEVLRNLCYQLASGEGGGQRWDELRVRIQDLFQVELEVPVYVAERGEIAMAYREGENTRLDLASAGRGLQQTLLLLSYLALHPGSVLLLDEPDAHLELLRQREIYQVLHDAARKHGSQLIMASHSEEVLNQAAGTSPDSVVAFLGKPHRIPPSRATALRRALDAYRFDQYYQAEQKGWVLYLEDRTDLRVLQAFAARLNHRAGEALRSPFLVPVGNQPNQGRGHFSALAEAKPDLTGFLLVDQDAPELQNRDRLAERKWTRREIENYVCQPRTLESFAREVGRSAAAGPLFEEKEAGAAVDAMQTAIRDHVAPAALRDPNHSWWRTMKASDEFLDVVLPAFYQALGRRVELAKGEYYLLVPHIPDELIDPEVREVLDSIAEVASRARPVAEE